MYNALISVIANFSIVHIFWQKEEKESKTIKIKMPLSVLNRKRYRPFLQILINKSDNNIKFKKILTNFLTLNRKVPTS